MYALLMNSYPILMWRVTYRYWFEWGVIFFVLHVKKIPEGKEDTITIFRTAPHQVPKGRKYRFSRRQNNPGILWEATYIKRNKFLKGITLRAYFKIYWILTLSIGGKLVCSRNEWTSTSRYDQNKILKRNNICNATITVSSCYRFDHRLQRL